MQDMTRFNHRRIALYGAVRSSFFDHISSVASPPTCKHIANSVLADRLSFWVGMRSLQLFPTLADAVCRIERDGLRADWEKVGHDVRRVMDQEAKFERSDVA